MSHRPNNAKKLARLRKSLTRHSLPAYIDLVQYLKDRGHAQTTGQAKRMLLDGKVRVGANAVGRRPDSNAKDVTVPQHPQRLLVRRRSSDITDGFLLTPMLDARLRDDIQVLA